VPRRSTLRVFLVGLGIEQSTDLQHSVAITCIAGSLGCRAQAAPPAERAENDQLQIDRPSTELNICSFFDQPGNFGRGFGSSTIKKPNAAKNDRRSRVVATVEELRKASEDNETRPDGATDLVAGRLLCDDR
jgi:hypothetical protein